MGHLDSPMERLIGALADHGDLMTPLARSELVERGPSMDLEGLVDFVLVAEGFGDLALVTRRTRGELARWIGPFVPA